MNVRSRRKLFDPVIAGQQRVLLVDWRVHGHQVMGLPVLQALSVPSRATGIEASVGLREGTSLTPAERLRVKRSPRSVAFWAWRVSYGGREYVAWEGELLRFTRAG